MHNERMHEALCRLYPDAPAGAWELACGPDTDWGVAVAAWNMPGEPPTQEELDAEYARLAEALVPVDGPDIPIGVAEQLYTKAQDPVANPEAVALLAILDL